MKTTPENQTADGSPSGAASCSASPGPWKSHLGAEDDPDRWIVVADNGTRPYHIATVENGQPGDTLDTEKATADLMAAAPELLDALKAALPLIDDALENMKQQVEIHRLDQKKRERREAVVRSFQVQADWTREVIAKASGQNVKGEARSAAELPPPSC